MKAHNGAIIQARRRTYKSLDTLTGQKLLFMLPDVERGERFAAGNMPLHICSAQTDLPAHRNYCP